jgi:UDP-glucose 4-epimerase
MVSMDDNSNKTEKQVCLVLGGNGFIGSHIVDKLAEKKNTLVRVLDPFFVEPQFHKKRNVVAIKGNAFDKETLMKALKGVDYVVHSLAATNPFTADKDPYADIENLQRSVEIFDCCRQAGVKKVAFISSGGAVYGKLAESKQATESDVTMPVSPYGICKLSTEQYLEYFKRKYGMDYIVYRLSNPYGPRQAFKKEQGVIPAFYHAIIGDEELTVMGDGTASRDYIYIEDAASMMADGLLGKNCHAIYNIGSGEQTTLNEIIVGLEKILGKKVRSKNLPAPPTILQKTDISVGRFYEEFGQPLVTKFYDGLNKTIETLRSQSALF